MKTDALQTAIFDRLRNSAPLMAALSTAWNTDALFSDVPEVEGDDDSYFPYISFGPDVAAPWNTKSSLGAEVSVQIDIWSRQSDFTEAKAIASLVYDRLERQPLTIAGAHHVTTDIQSITTALDPDGRTRRALILMTVIYDDI
jgi:hypothetical protein